jgi:heat shock protein HtpX
MIWFKRIGLFLLINILVMVTISITSSLIFGFLGVRPPVGYEGLLIMCALFGFGGSFISLMLSKFMAKRFYGVQIIDPETPDLQLRDLVATVHQISRKAGLTVMPEVGIYEAPEINAFATGPSKNNAMVALSSGLFRALNKDEVEGVIGHEVTHIANGDMVTMTLIQGIVNTFVLFLSRILASIIAGNSNSESRRGTSMMEWMLIMAFDMLFSILASLAVNYFSRRREFRADAGGAQYAGREKMIAGLRKLQSQFDQIPVDNGAAAALRISNRSTGIKALFSTHPSLEDRIERLQRLS